MHLRHALLFPIALSYGATAPLVFTTLQGGEKIHPGTFDITWEAVEDGDQIDGYQYMKTNLCAGGSEVGTFDCSLGVVVDWAPIAGKERLQGSISAVDETQPENAYFLEHILSADGNDETSPQTVYYSARFSLLAPNRTHSEYLRSVEDQDAGTDGLYNVLGLRSELDARQAAAPAAAVPAAPGVAAPAAAAPAAAAPAAAVPAPAAAAPVAGIPAQVPAPAAPAAAAPVAANPAPAAAVPAAGVPAPVAVAPAGGAIDPAAAAAAAAAAPAAPAPPPADPAAFLVPYEDQTGPVRYAPMQPQPPTKITKSTASAQYPSSSVSIATAYLPPPTVTTTITQPQTLTASSRINTEPPAIQPSQDVNTP